MIRTHKTITNCYPNIAQVEGVSSMPIWASKTKNRQKNAKNRPKISKIHLNLRIIIKFIWISRNLQTTTETILKLKQNHNQTS